MSAIPPPERAARPDVAVLRVRAFVRAYRLVYLNAAPDCAVIVADGAPLYLADLEALLDAAEDEGRTVGPGERRTL